MDLEKEIAYYRCQNKPVIFIAKTLNIECKTVRYILNKWKKETYNYIFNLKSDSIPFFNPDITGILKKSDLSVEYAKKILLNKYVINYIILNRNEAHNRYMDCIRYHIHLILNS
ncbi:hypothetical protein DFR86_01550 [Acidianus sulfidivorans JP7]|uniref:Uncharacterized protein n=1 Tax=Acidianus sulfidivorans JP7 TaxID=619593 RepID=A0A2U9IK19_9CREN|nr:hypothetical protein [Acidianus sulfidivorans]AWR96360.1 hypothetical protein DFR86_01550 [Acidianus sulfidivorans JP7]